MRILVVSDIHANLTALQAVLEDAPDHDSIWCLGDLVGYGPDPNECVDLMRSQQNLLCLLGNHDQAAMGAISLARFNLDARDATTWTRRALSDENRAFLRNRPSTITVGNYTLAHGSPRQPLWEYIFDPRVAENNFESIETPYCLVGHSHIPQIFHKPSPEIFTSAMTIRPEKPIPLRPKMIFNPGSVGQPRDLDSRASYAILDTSEKTWMLRRVPYDITQVQARFRQAGLPTRQATRLSNGW